MIFWRSRVLAFDLDYNFFVTFVDKAEEYETDADDDSDYHAPNEQLVASPLPLHLLSQLLICFLHILRCLAKILVDHFQLSALNLRLRLNISRDVSHITHQTLKLLECLISGINHVGHLVRLRCLVHPI